jgi:hypothetical protein
MRTLRSAWHILSAYRHRNLSCVRRCG